MNSLTLPDGLPRDALIEKQREEAEEEGKTPVTRPLLAGWLFGLLDRDTPPTVFPPPSPPPPFLSPSLRSAFPAAVPPVAVLTTEPSDASLSVKAESSKTLSRFPTLLDDTTSGVDLHAVSGHAAVNAYGGSWRRAASAAFTQPTSKALRTGGAEAQQSCSSTQATIGLTTAQPDGRDYGKVRTITTRSKLSPSLRLCLIRGKPLPVRNLEGEYTFRREKLDVSRFSRSQVQTRPLHHLVQAKVRVSEVWVL